MIYGYPVDCSCASVGKKHLAPSRDTVWVKNSLVIVCKLSNLKTHLTVYHLKLTGSQYLAIIFYHFRPFTNLLVVESVVLNHQNILKTSIIA